MDWLVQFDLQFQTALAEYPDSGYHNKSHILALKKILDNTDLRRDCPAAYCVLGLAIAYHDIVHNQLTEHDNVVQSAKYCEQNNKVFSGMYYRGYSVLYLACNLIFSDRDASTPASYLLGSVADLRQLAGLFLDWDRGILAQDEETYARYVRGLEQEYQTFPEFNQHRIMWLANTQKQLNNQTYYYAHPEWHATALRNVNNELKMREAAR